MRLVLLLCVLLLPACQGEYDLQNKEDPPPAPIDTGSIFEGLDECPNESFPGYSGGSDKQCRSEIQTGSFTPVVEWRKTSFGQYPNSTQVMSQPIVTTLNDDNGDGKVDSNDIPDIVVVTYDAANFAAGGVIRAVSGDGAFELWSVSAGVQGTGGVAAGDIDNDGHVEILSLTPTSLKAFEHDGTLKWTSPNIANHINGISDVPAISDMDGDGNPEIIAGRAIINSDGTLRGAGNAGRGGPAGNVGTCSFAVDLNGDGIQEVVTGNALYDPDGNTIMSNSQLDGYPAVADFDGDGQGEIIVSGDGRVRAQETSGQVMWTTFIPGAGTSFFVGPPTIADFDGDGEPEIGVAANNSYTVLESNGSVLWTTVTQDGSSGNTGSSVFDFEGDGVSEVVYADEMRLWVFSGLDGSVKLESTEHSNGTWLEYPVIADVDGDGNAEIVVGNTAQFGSDVGFYVFGDLNNSWRPGRRTWNQYAYHITNVDDDGGIPNKPKQNWKLYNNFRSGDLSQNDGTKAPDLTLAKAAMCDIECSDGRLVLWVHPGNEGASNALGGATLVVTAVSGGNEVQIASETLTAPLPKGEYLDAVQLELSGFDFNTYDQIKVRIEAHETECDTSNNEVWWDGPFCQ